MMPLEAQLCHASIAVDTYVRGLPTTDRGAVDSLDDTPWRQTPRRDAPRLATVLHLEARCYRPLPPLIKSSLEQPPTTDHDGLPPGNSGESES
jgi:hypothetical protein